MNMLQTKWNQIAKISISTLSHDTTTKKIKKE